MRSFPHTPKYASVAAGRRMLSFKSFQRSGGTAGMIREIIYGWKHPFTVNQLKITFHRRHPELVLGDFQIDDIIQQMVERGTLSRDSEGRLRRSPKPERRLVIKLRVSKPQMLFNL